MHSLNSVIAGATVRWHDFPGNGIPVVFIHGLGCASSYEYPRIVTEPALRERRTILIDLPGSGYSDKPHDFDFSTTQQAAVVMEVIDYLGLSQLDLYGHSMGGSIAIEVAERLGQRLHTLAVSEPNFHSGGGFYSRLVVAEPESEFVARSYERILANDKTPWRGCLQNVAPWAMWRGAKSLVEGVSPSWMARFLALDCERALIFGERSLPDDDAAAVVNAGIPLHIVPEAGHSMSWENPSALAVVLGQVFAQKGS
ncbi:alpha/beta fold hydrolase [Scandinavium manionii]|uniref:alpha/beta fold hydrolase n=1 Tax=Scandinavium manionii TaxID=2926520 RepID=UPI0021666566|nr:alpha/beta hydrolase [Scandinavium manionii]MCS2148122.1 alpha/beta hydrolase [Scandinavium manionii]